MPSASDDHQLPDLLAQVHREVHTDLTRLLVENDGLAVEQWRILSILGRGDGLSMSELSERAFITISALSKIIDRMVSRALVHRRQDSADHRRVLIYITTFGEEMLRSRAPVVERYCDDIVRILGRESADQLAGMLRTILSSKAGQ